MTLARVSGTSVMLQDGTKIDTTGTKRLDVSLPPSGQPERGSTVDTHTVRPAPERPDPEEVARAEAASNQRIRHVALARTPSYAS
jgi:hypothetical protein